MECSRRGSYRSYFAFKFETVLRMYCLVWTEENDLIETSRIMVSAHLRDRALCRRPKVCRPAFPLINLSSKRTPWDTEARPAEKLVRRSDPIDCKCDEKPVVNIGAAFGVWFLIEWPKRSGTWGSAWAVTWFAGSVRHKMHPDWSHFGLCCSSCPSVKCVRFPELQPRDQRELWAPGGRYVDDVPTVAVLGHWVCRPETASTNAFRDWRSWWMQLTGLPACWRNEDGRKCSWLCSSLLLLWVWISDVGILLWMHLNGLQSVTPRTQQARGVWRESHVKRVCWILVTFRLIGTPGGLLELPDLQVR